MSVKFMEGFDVEDLTQHHVTNGWVNSGSSETHSWPSGPLGGNCVRYGSGAGTTQDDKDFAKEFGTGGLSEFYCGFRFRWASGTFASTRTPVSFMTQAQVAIANFNITTGGLFQIAGQTGTTPVVTSVWYYIEIYLKINGASGSVQLRVNGVTEVGPTTVNVGSTNFRVMECLAAGGTSWDMDDLWICDTTADAGANPNNTFLGDCYVETLQPTGDGASTSWTPSTGTSHSALVDDDPANADTDYNSDSTSGHRDSFTHGTPSGATVFAVANSLIVRKDDAGQRTVASVVRQGSTNYDGTTSPGLNLTYLQHLQIYSGQSPDGNDWTPSTAGSAEFGIKVV